MNLTTIKLLLAFTLSTTLLSCAESPSPHTTSTTTQTTTTSPGSTTKPTHAHSHKSSKIEYGLTSLDIYSDHNTLHLLTSHRTPNQPTTIHYQSSTDSGATWSSPTRVGADQPAPDVARPGMDVQIAAAGQTLIAVWTTFSESSRFGRGPLAAAFSHDTGQTWHAAPNPADDGKDTDHAFIDIAADATGQFHLVWLDARAGQKGLIYATTRDGKSWSKNRTLLPETCECCWNEILTAPSGQLHILYRQKSPRDMAILSSPDSGATWTKPVTVGAFGWDVEACPHVGGALALLSHANKQTLFATVWTAREGVTGAHLLTSTDSGMTWSNPRPLGPGAWHTDIATSPTGQVALIYDAYTDDGLAIFSSLSTDAGQTFSPPTRLTSPSTSATHPRILWTNEGFRALWTQTPESDQPHWVLRPIP